MKPASPSATPKRVLLIHYSQTGQLSAVAEQIAAPLKADPGIDLHVETLVPLTPYPYPWPFFRFLDAFPESAHLVPPPLQPLSLTGDEHFDLVILPYQVWFLAPSLPFTAFLKHPVGRRLLAGKPVVTVIACRNMWLSAHEKVKALLDEAGARLIDNVALIDPGPTLATFITTPRWLLSGKKDGFWGMPAAGLSDDQVRRSRRFGLALRDALHTHREQGPGPLLDGLAAAEVNPSLYFSERAGTRSFFIWGKLIRLAGGPGRWTRRPLLAIYVVFLIAMIVTLVPTSLALQALLRPVMRPWLSRIRDRFEQPSGSATHRLPLYDE
ncbi:dialkylrecorsinol condensing enzyme [Rhizobacter sp. Root1221]|uniref:dialkylrecorsinol condensing enzyme n=1 Tax=Rhizobacter sp. Root1221 TaxID=1736433 RepID=UPI0013DD8DD6|nr:dialkylrecorsinol condensing enzyme [Rhizobacter sp. Root1221]